MFERRLRVNDETADQNSGKVISEKSGIVSNGGSEEVANCAEKPPTSSDLDSTTSAGDNDREIYYYNDKDLFREYFVTTK